MAVVIKNRNLWPLVRSVVGVSFDGPNIVPQDKLPAFAVAELAAGTPMRDGTVEFQIPTGPVAKLAFKGPYTRLKSGYEYLFGQ
jgi:DNA gyrase inhibitor GyrI